MACVDMMYVCSPGCNTLVLSWRNLPSLFQANHKHLVHVKNILSFVIKHWKIRLAIFSCIPFRAPFALYTSTVYCGVLGVENILKSISQMAVVVRCLFLQTLTEMPHTTNPPSTLINIELYLKCSSKNTAHFCWIAWIICHYGINKTKRFKIVESLGFYFGVWWG